MPDPNIEEGVKNFRLATGAALLRATNSIEFPFDWTITGANISLGLNQGPCLAMLEINPSGTTGQTAGIKTQWIRGSSVSGGTGSLNWIGEIELKNKSFLFALVRNDTGATVDIALLWTGRRFPPVVRVLG